MKKLIVTADIHGSHTAWLTLKTLINKGDMLMVAGDLFDVKYGNYANPDFSPDTIKKELNDFPHPFYYVYGNCDSPSYFPGHTAHLEVCLFNKTILLHHGDRSMIFPPDTDIIVQGHTHLAVLEKRNKQLLLNPGSLAKPRNGLYTYATIDREKVCLIELRSEKTLKCLDL